MRIARAINDDVIGSSISAAGPAVLGDLPDANLGKLEQIV